MCKRALCEVFGCFMRCSGRFLVHGPFRALRSVLRARLPYAPRNFLGGSRAAQTAGCTPMRGGRHGICKLSGPGSGPLAARGLPRRGVLLLWACHIASHAAWHCCRAAKPGQF